MNDIKDPIQKRGIEKKIKLIESARKVFNDKGYHNTYIKDITAEGSMSVGLFYKYFKDKNEIYIEVIKSMIEREMTIVREFKAKIIESDNKKEVVRSYIEKRVQMHVYNRIMEEFHVLIKEKDPIKEALNNAKKEYLDEIKAILIQIWNNPTESSLHIGVILIWRTIYSNIIEINNISDIGLKNEYIDNLTNLIYKYMELD